MTERLARPRSWAPVSPDILNYLVLGAVAIVVLAMGVACAAVLPDKVSPWLSMSAFAAPAGLAFLAYWWIDQRP